MALVITELEVGGAEKCLVNLAIGLNPTRFEPVVYSLAPRPPEGKDALVRQLAAGGIATKFLNLRSRWQFFTAVSRLKQCFKEQQPQVMQSFLFHANVIGTMAAHRARVPNIVTGIRVADPSRWRQRVERWLAPRVDQMVCVSQGVETFCRHTCRFPEAKLQVIPNGIELESSAHVTPARLTELGLATGRRALLFVGRLNRQKGLDWLIRDVLPDLLAALPEHDLVLVGDGPERQELMRLAAAGGIAARVHFVGWRPDVPAIMAAADVLLLPSRYEGMPNVVLEAMAIGLPIVATRAEGVAELLGAAAEEQACAADDVDGFRERVVRLIADQPFSRQMIGQNRTRAEQRFSLTAMIQAYERLYESLLER